MAPLGSTLEICRPRARLRVGVTGHRPGPKLSPQAESKVRDTVRRLLDAIGHGLAGVTAAHNAMYASEPADLVVVSSLAEGADRIVAEVGLARGAALEVVLPGPRAVYRNDFESEASKTAFDALLGKAQSVFELDSPPGELSAKRGYQAAGLIMLGHADLLVAIWDEGESGGIGGTAEIVEQAVNGGCPVMLINPGEPDRISLLWTGDVALPPLKARVEQLPKRDGLDALPELIATLAAPPGPTGPRGELEAFYGEPHSRRRWTPCYTLFLVLLGVRKFSLADFGPAYEDDAPGEEWRGHFPQGHGEDGLTLAVRMRLLPAIARADALAVLYGEFYRAAFVFNYLAAATAVALALFGLLPELPQVHSLLGDAGGGWLKAALVAGELMLILAILWIWRRGAARQWHRRWLDYRRLAEQMRHLRILTLVGIRSLTPRPRVTSHVDHTKPPAAHAPAHEPLDRPDWVDWLLRANERMLPLPNRAVNDAYVTAVRGAVTKAELCGQIKYNDTNATRMDKAERVLHAVGYALFATPAFICLGFLALFFLNHCLAHEVRFYVTALSAICPSFGAALNAIRMQGDFESVARRSATTKVRLEAIRDAMHQPEPIDFARLADLVQKTAEVLGADVSEWRALFRTRPLGLPA